MQCLQKIKLEDGQDVQTIVIGDQQKLILSPRVEFRRVIKHHSIDGPNDESRIQIVTTKSLSNHCQLVDVSPNNQHVKVIRDGRFYDDQNHIQQQQHTTIITTTSNPQIYHHPNSNPQQEVKKIIISNRPVNIVTSNGTNSPDRCSNSDSQIFRPPVVSSTSSNCNNTMRPPPPPPPPKMKNTLPPEEPSSSIPDLGFYTNGLPSDILLEFDGTTVLCRVCGDKASGFHYGVHSCEGCKGFFRRSIQQKIQYRPCTKNQQCSILRINRNRCQYCRLKKCIAVGMSRDAVRFGRVPKREKARILAAMQQSTQNRGHQRALATELDDQPRLLASVLRAHMETCEFTREKVSSMRQRARDCPSYSMPTLACPLNPAPELQSEQEFSQRFAHVIRGVIDFAGMIPGFQLLSQDDKFTLLKAGLFDALFVRLICMFDSSINSIICLNGQVMRRDTIQNGANARFLVDSTFNFAERMNAMNLTDAEIGLFCAIVLITPDRPGLRNVELIEKMYSKLKACLQMVISQNRPDKPEFMQELLKTMPDLRTLSTLHTEKLVVFRTEHKELMRQQMWTLDDDASKSPIGSWGSSSDAHLDDLAKSPMGSVSSTESNEIINDLHHHHNANVSSLSASAPLLAATLTGQCPIRHHRMNSGSSAEDDLAGAAHLAQNGLTITPVIRSVPVSSHLQNVRYRKLDSPTDSGIESGNEKHDHHCSSNSKTISSGSSSCSSPRSSLEDQTEDSKRHIVEQMPVLKRVLQAPPLYDTNSLMDEAYKPHKKFRAMRQNTSVSCNSRESEAESCTVAAESTTTANSPPMSATPTTTIVPLSSATIPMNNNNPIPQQSQLHMHLTRPLNTHNNHQNNYHHHHQTTPSSLSSTHSVLAKSLMEEPRMTPEQMKRSDIIQNYLMRESQKSNGLLVCAPQSPPTGAGCPYTGARGGHQLAAATTSVITTSSRQQTPSPSLHHHRYFQSPHSTSSNSSSSSPPTAQSPRILELQVDMATASTDAPLNLSKKSPSPPPPAVQTPNSRPTSMLLEA